MRRAVALAMAVLLGAASAVEAAGQSVTGFSPNIRGDWTMPRWQAAFVLNHRFEIISGGDELISIPTLTLGTMLPWGLAAGLDFTSNSEIVPARLGGNETQFWLMAPVLRRDGAGIRGMLAYNRAARSADAALTGRARSGPLSLLGEVRAFSNFLGTNDAGVVAAGGVLLHVTPYLEVGGDLARAIEPDTPGTVWSGGLSVRIPGTPHTFSVHAANAGALTLQGVSRRKILGPQDVRYGFTFTVPLGSRMQWARIFRRAQPAPAADTTVAASIDIRDVAFAPREVRVHVGDAVAWFNRDPVPHTVTAVDRSWRSGFLSDGDRYVRVFAAPGRYEYFCEPHPQMTGVVIVEERR